MRRFTRGRASTGGLEVRGETAAGFGNGERQAEAAVGGRDARQRRVEGPARKKMVTPAAGREAVAHLRGGFAMSERRACRVAAVAQSSVRYRHRRCDDNRLRERLKALAEERRRFGYRRLWVLLRREGHTVNRKRVYRLYKEERLMVRRRVGRKRTCGFGMPRFSLTRAKKLPRAAECLVYSLTPSGVLAENPPKNWGFV